jgi:hypothetical protein
MRTRSSDNNVDFVKTSFKGRMDFICFGIQSRSVVCGEVLGISWRRYFLSHVHSVRKYCDLEKKSGDFELFICFGRPKYERVHSNIPPVCIDMRIPKP